MPVADVPLAKFQYLHFLFKKQYLAIYWLLITTVLLCLPGESIPGAKNDWLARIHADKWVHVCLFAILVFLFCHSGPVPPKTKSFLVKPWLFIVAAGILYGIVMECVQLWFIAGRGFEVTDILADAAGCIAGYLLARKFLFRGK